MDRNGGNATNMARKMLETGKVSLNISSIDWWSEISDRVAPKGTGRWKLLCWKCWTQKGEGQGSRFCPCSFMMSEGSWLACTAYERYEPMWTDVNRCEPVHGGTLLCGLCLSGNMQWIGRICWTNCVELLNCELSNFYCWLLLRVRKPFLHSWDCSSVWVIRILAEGVRHPRRTMETKSSNRI